jgi:hypothetical protein
MVLTDDLAERPESADELRERAATSPRSEDVEVTDVFDDAFVAANTDFETFDEMVAASPSPAETAAELELIRDGTWDEFVAERTVFDDEEELVLEARDHWVAVQLDIEE